MTILVTGANSFLGSNLVRRLADAGQVVFGTYRTEDKRIAELQNRPSVKLFRLDIAEPAAFNSIRDQVDTVIHVAAVSPTETVTVEDMISCNIVGTHNVHAFALRNGVKRFIFISSVSVYGNVTTPVLAETTSLSGTAPLWG